ncbi:hypothetical protein LSUE1_G007906 [Lachnellula suecica]|uniref:Uncharacterized protein n=1 Tax=Lachnellula suecica TaxID=602035 RepID=A0A8T9BYU2_9HELO|nr:hypothetical protein LSUE1_G007906 [Lachnellula suecica]
MSFTNLPLNFNFTACCLSFHFTMMTIISDQPIISAFNRGPVTSIFTPPASCQSVYTAGAAGLYFDHFADGYIDTACYPSTTSSSGVANWDTYFYSPAQCSSAWSHAVTITSSFGRGPTFLSLGPTTTAVVCCPL